MTHFSDAKIWEDGLRTDPTKKSYEWWYFDAQFSDGSTLVITFFTKQPQFASGPLAPSINVVYTDSKKKKQSFNKNILPSDFSASTESCDLAFGKTSAKGDLKTYTINLDLDGIRGNVVFHRIAPSYSTTREKSEKTADFGWFPAIPYGTVDAEIEINGEKKQFKGTGYHDHNWGVVDMKDFCDYWYWGRGVAGDYYIVYSVMYLRKILGGRHASILYVANKDTILIGQSDHLELTESDISPHRPRADLLPKDLTFTTTDSQETTSFSISHPVLIESVDPFEGLTGWKMFLTHLFSKPRYVRFTADLTLNFEKKKHTGTTLFEIMIFR